MGIDGRCQGRCVWSHPRECQSCTSPFHAVQGAALRNVRKDGFIDREEETPSLELGGEHPGKGHLIENRLFCWETHLYF